MTHDNFDICAWTEERLELFLDGELSGSENLRFQTHIKECESCAAYWADDEALSEALLMAVAPDLSADELQERDPSFAEHVLEDRERPITHHSSSVVFVGRSSLLWSGISAAAASIITAFVCIGLMNNDGDPVADAVIASNQVAGAEVGFALGRVSMRPVNGDAWLPVTGAARIEAGYDFRTAADSRLQIRLDGDRGQLLLAENSSVRIEHLPENEADSVEFELDSGRIFCDLNAAGFRAGTLGIDVYGRDASFDLTRGSDDLGPSQRLDARLAVTRGRVVANADIGAERTLEEGRVYAVKHGMLMEFDELDRVNPVRLTGGAQRWPMTAVLDDRQPEDEISNLETADGGGLTADTVEAWLSRVERRGALDLVDLDADAAKMLRDMRVAGEQGLAIVRALMSQERDPLRRKALVGLAGAQKSVAARRFLEEACGDASLRVRRAAVLCLSECGKSVAPHFLAVCLREKDPTLRLTTAFLAAHGGEKRGLTEMILLYDLSKSQAWRSQVVELVARLPMAIQERALFLSNVIRSVAVAEDENMLALAVRGLVGTGQKKLAEKSLDSLELRLKAGDSAVRDAVHRVRAVLR